MNKVGSILETLLTKGEVKTDVTVVLDNSSIVKLAGALLLVIVITILLNKAVSKA